MIGDLGKKIHTGRSRNDQSLTMIRMFMKDSLWECTGEVSKLIYTINEQFEKYRDDIFIGYSHTQQAMPITIGHYFGAHKESLHDDMNHLILTSDFINQNPLGTGAGFGSPLDVNRNVISRTLDFNKTQNNSLYCQNSRGKFELLFIQSLSQVMLSLQKLATDMIFYTTRELALFKMSDSLSQGSSMMPQKKNPDVFELIRAKSADVLSLEERVKLIIKGLPSGYNRDLQEIKACIVDAYNITKNCTYIMQLAMKHITPDIDAINKKLESDIVAADYAISKCIKDRDLNFRDVYKETMTGEITLKPEDAVGLRKSKGSPMNM
jgi:argininosuccinate lyase